MRNYGFIETYLDTLALDIYPQPIDSIHQNQTLEVIVTWINQMAGKIKSILDVGCGQGVAFPYFKDLKFDYTGITLGPDFDVCAINPELKDKVKKMDMSFLSFGDNNFDLVFARHVLEHSPAPLLTLMEWHRVAKKFCVVVVPHHCNVIQGGINHYYMLDPIQWKVLFKRAGWVVSAEDFRDPSEYRFLLVKP